MVNACHNQMWSIGRFLRHEKFRCLVNVVAAGLSNCNKHFQWCMRTTPKPRYEIQVQCPCQHSAQDISQQKRHIPYPPCHHILPLMSHRERHMAIFEGTPAFRMAAVSLIIAWRKMVNKGHGIWLVLIELPWWKMLCEHCFYLPSGFLFYSGLTLVVF